MDFQVGKDVGLGLFGDGEASAINFGVRVAQINSRQSLVMHADPDYTFPANLKYDTFHHTYTVTSHMRRSFHGLGPTISWKASEPVEGDTQNGVFAVDWGVNAAILMGHQKAVGHHQTDGQYYKGNAISRQVTTTPIHRSGSFDRSRTVTVPNLGGFVGLSMKYQNAKVSFGYRADEFFGAMDGGVDARRSENVGFFGPYAKISVGLGG